MLRFFFIGGDASLNSQRFTSLSSSSSEELNTGSLSLEYSKEQTGNPLHSFHLIMSNTMPGIVFSYSHCVV